MINELVVFFKLGSFSINPALPGLNKKGKSKKDYRQLVGTLFRK